MPHVAAGLQGVCWPHTLFFFWRGHPDLNPGPLDVQPLSTLSRTPEAEDPGQYTDTFILKIFLFLTN